MTTSRSRTHWHYDVGQPVVRGLRRGVIVERYDATGSWGYHHPELYAVRFDDSGQIERGFFWFGLESARGGTK